MKSQWDCVLQNLGQWQGSFTHLSPQGDVREDIPSLITLEGVDQNSAVHLVLTRYYPTAPGSTDCQPQDLIMDFSEPATGAIFFETGAFSHGAQLFGGYDGFGTESCLVTADRRLRLVQQFNGQRTLKLLTLIREQRVGTNTPERPPLTPADLLGDWQGQSVTLLADRSEPHSGSTTFQLRQESGTGWMGGYSQFPNDDLHPTTVTLTAANLLTYEAGEQSYQTLFLPDGAASTCPQLIQAGRPFTLELSWLLEPGVRERIIRHYDRAGQWQGVTFSRERRR